MEEKRAETMDLNHPRKLDLNLPLLSTRRLGGHVGEGASCKNSQPAWRDTSNRIPFCWEQVPGKPKDTDRRKTTGNGDTPRPRLPPGRWRSPKGTTAKDEDDNDDHAEELIRNNHDHDDGCDADVDDDDDDNEDDVFSDAIDVFSLTEAIDIVQRAENDHGLDRFALESADFSASQSPNFMIERFLPDATALAATSALAFSRNLSNKFPYACSYPEGKGCASRPPRRSFHSQKGCGLEFFFPWRMKHKLCGVKSPVLPGPQNPQAPCNGKQKKHFASANRTFRDLIKDV